MEVLVMRRLGRAALMLSVLALAPTGAQAFDLSGFLGHLELANVDHPIPPPKPLPALAQAGAVLLFAVGGLVTGYTVARRRRTR